MRPKHRSKIELSLLCKIQTANTWHETPVTDPGTYRYLYYSGPYQSSSMAWEQTFHDPDGSLLSGTVIGNLPALVGNEPVKAHDGTLSTLYKFSNGNFGFVGLDLGTP